MKDTIQYSVDRNINIKVYVSIVTFNGYLCILSLSFLCILYKALSENHVAIIFIDYVSKQGAFYLMVYPDDIQAHIPLA